MKCQTLQRVYQKKSLQNLLKDKFALRIYSITLCDITIEIVTHSVDWFSCLVFVLLQHTPSRPPNLIF